MNWRLQAESLHLGLNACCRCCEPVSRFVLPDSTAARTGWATSAVSSGPTFGRVAWLVVFTGPSGGSARRARVAGGGPGRRPVRGRVLQDPPGQWVGRGEGGWGRQSRASRRSPCGIGSLLLLARHPSPADCHSLYTNPCACAACDLAGGRPAQLFAAADRPSPLIPCLSAAVLLYLWPHAGGAGVQASCQEARATTTACAAPSRRGPVTLL